MSGDWRRTLRGMAWCASWTVVLWGIDRPWRHLGGIVHERLRWLETVVLFMGLLAGHTVGSLLRPRASRLRWSHLRALRPTLYPVLGAAVVGTTTLDAAGEPELQLIVFTGLLAYWAGLDAGLAALPLLRRDNPPPAQQVGPIRCKRRP